MNYNVTFAGKAPQKVVNMGKETIEKIAKDAGYTKPFEAFDKGMTEAAEAAAKKADKAIENTFKPYNILEAEARAAKKDVVVDESIMNVPFN